MFDSLQSEEVLKSLKDEFIDGLVNNYNFDEIYTESEKYEYFSKLQIYIHSLKVGLEKQIAMSHMKLNELYTIYDYEEYNKILETLSWTVEYVESNYTEINLIEKSITKHEIPDKVRKDLHRIKEFLKLN